jgi:hypothetical protein
MSDKAHEKATAAADDAAAVKIQSMQRQRLAKAELARLRAEQKSDPAATATAGAAPAVASTGAPAVGASP